MGRVLVILVFLLGFLGVIGATKSVGELEIVRTMRFLKNNADRFEVFTGQNSLDLARLASAEYLTLMVPNDDAFADVAPFMNSLTPEEKVKLLEFHALLDELDFSPQVHPKPELDKVTQDGKRYVVERDVSSLASLISGQHNSYNVLALMSNFSIHVRTGINKPAVLETLRTVPHLKVYEVDQVLIPRALKHKFFAAMFPPSSAPVRPPVGSASSDPTVQLRSAAVSAFSSWPLTVVAAAAALLFV